MMKGKSVFVKIEERIAMKLKKQERFKSDAEKAQEAGMYLCQCDALCFPEEWSMYQWCCKKCVKEVPATPTPVRQPRERMASMYPFRDDRSLSPPPDKLIPQTLFSYNMKDGLETKNIVISSCVCGQTKVVGEKCNHCNKD
jgi:hypothetical protein